MLKNVIHISLGVIFVIIIYLLAVNWLIYYRIGAFNLQASDIKYRRIFNEQIATSSSDIVYISFGDSLTAGVGVDNYKDSYPYLIAQKIAGTNARVIHFDAAYPGARTGDIINFLLENAIIQKPTIVTILIGTNDVHGNVSSKLFRSNYEFIIKELKTKTSAKINVVSIPFIGTDSLFLPPFNFYYNQKTLTFNKIIEELSVQNNINYIDLTTPTRIYAAHDSSYYAVDDFHPSGLGYKYWSKIIYDNLDK
jgi:lysophospholipase L1-like esterase